MRTIVTTKPIQLTEALTERIRKALGHPRWPQVTGGLGFSGLMVTIRPDGSCEIGVVWTSDGRFGDVKGLDEIEQSRLRQAVSTE